MAGTTVTFTASATGCGTPLFRYWTRAPGGGGVVAQDVTLSNTFVWNTSGLAAGTYNVLVWINGNGSSASVETFKLVTLTP